MRLLIGLGTGRCGTVSLSQLLDAQPGVRMLHEGMIDGRHHLVRWYDDVATLDRWIATLAERMRGADCFGDVGMYFLPYVEHLIEAHPDARFLVMRRDREATVESYLKKTEGRNHWMDHDGTVWASDPLWDPAYPTYDAPDKPTALRRYWDEYYVEAERLRAAYPEHVAIFEMVALNSEAGRAAILDHAGVHAEERVTESAFHANKTPRWKSFLAKLPFSKARADRPS